MEKDPKTRLEHLQNILVSLPDEVIEKAYVLNLGHNGPEVQMPFSSALLRYFGVMNQVSLDANCYVQFRVTIAGYRVQFTMT